MRTEQFIEKCVNGEITIEKRVSSVFFNGKDTIYSYGYHYPLLMKTRAGWVLNDTGYSATTGKHISWARRFAMGLVKYTYYINMSQGFNSQAWDENSILKAVGLEIVNIQKEKNKLSKRAWKQLERFENRQKGLRILQARIRSNGIFN